MIELIESDALRMKSAHCGNLKQILIATISIH